MQRGLTVGYLGFVAGTVALAIYLLLQSTTWKVAPITSKEVYAYYGLQYSEEESIHVPQLVDSQPPPAFPNPAVSEEHPRPALPLSALPHDALGEISDSLTESQCNDAFPELYHAIDRSARHWFIGQQRITQEDTDISWRSDAAVRFMIHKNEVRVLETKGVIGVYGYHDRVMGILHLIQRAADSATVGGELLPTIEAALLVQDNSDPPTVDGTHSFWTMATNSNATHERLWLVPNYDFWGATVYGSYANARRKAADQDAAFVDKIPSAVWRGNPFWNMDLRQSLIDITKDQPWADVELVNPVEKQHSLSSSEYCKYAMTIHTEGISFAGRLTQLLLCNSLPIVHDLEWNTHYSHLLTDHGPDQNYVSVRRDWSNLQLVTNYYLQHPDEAEKVIANSIATFRDRHLTRAATSCYIRKLIKGYSSAAFEPRIERPHINGTVRKLRGVAFEAFAQHMSHDYDDENKDIADLQWP